MNAGAVEVAAPSSSLAARDAVGVVLLGLAGWDRESAALVMATDPGCRRVAGHLLPVVERLVVDVLPVIARLGSFVLPGAVSEDSR